MAEECTQPYWHPAHCRCITPEDIAALDRARAEGRMPKRVVRLRGRRLDAASGCQK